MKERAEDIFNVEWESLEAVMDRLDVCFDEAVDLLEDVLMPQKVSRCYQKILKKSDEIGGRAAIAGYLLLRTLTKAYDGQCWLLGHTREETLKDLCLAHYNRDYEKVISGCEDFEEDFQHMRENYDEMLRNGNL